MKSVIYAGFAASLSRPGSGDKVALSRKSRGARRRARRKQREALELGAFVKRMFKALVRRAAAGDLEAVEQLAALTRACQCSTKDAAEAAWTYGYSYTQIGDALGITRQAARQRFGGRAER